MGDTRSLERRLAEANAKGIISVVYPTLWLTPFLSIVLVSRSIAAEFKLPIGLAAVMAVVMELLGVTTGHNVIESRGKARVLAVVLFASYIITVGAFIAIADTWLGLVFPALSVVAILTANIQAGRQMARDDRAAAKATRALVIADQAGGQPAQPVVQILNQVGIVGQGGGQPAQLPEWKRLDVPREDRVRAWLLANPKGTLRQGQRDTDIPWATFREVANEVRKETGKGEQ